ncbi:ribosomal-protein-alanine acetyltransferase, partial [Rhizobiaceae sp. 2RAB30]
MMRLPFMRPRQRDFSIARLTGKETPVIARLHREDFVRPWTDDEFTALLGQDTVFGFVVLETGRASAGPAGFVLARLAAGE